MVVSNAVRIRKPIMNSASSKEFVGRLRFRQIFKVMIKTDFQSMETAITEGLFGNQFTIAVNASQFRAGKLGGLH